MNLSPQRIQTLMGSPTIGEEFGRKVKELDRRLKLNGMAYHHWETLNDRQQDIFSSNLFLDGTCAQNIENYVHGALDSCWCDDVVEELHHHSPALMKAIEDAQKHEDHFALPNDSLNDAIDNIFQNMLVEMASEAEVEAQMSKGCRYEKEVIRSLKEAGIQGDIEFGACDDSTGPDADFIINGQTYLLEVKLDKNAQMGGSSMRFYPLRGPGDRFEVVDEEKMDEAAQAAALAVLEKTYDRWRKFAEDIRDPEWPASEKWVDNVDVPATPFSSTATGWSHGLAAGTVDGNSLVNMTGAKAAKVKANFIRHFYKSKGIYYIQIGGLGLFYLASNPADLPVPQLDGEVNIELRPGKSGSKKLKDAEGNPVFELGPDGEPLLDRKGRKIKKRLTWPGAVSGDPFVKASGPLRAQARLMTDSGPSPYTLDDPESIITMLNVMNDDDPVTDLEVVIEPESEDL